jgi:hypothetical protein
LPAVRPGATNAKTAADWTGFTHATPFARKATAGSLGKELLGQHILDRPGAGLRELAKLKRANGLVTDRVTISLA